MKKILSFIGAVLLLFLYLTYDYLIMFLFNKLNIDIVTLSQGSRILIASLINLSFMLLLGLIYFKTLKKDMKHLKITLKKYFFICIIIWIISVLLMAVSNIIIYHYYPYQATNEVLVQSVLKKYPLYMIFSSIIYAPFVEELIFRRSFRNVINSKATYVITSGILFGYIHTLANVNNTLELLYIIPYGIVGAAFAYIYTKTDNIYVTMILHSLHNTIVIIISILSFLKV